VTGIVRRPAADLTNVLRPATSSNAGEVSGLAPIFADSRAGNLMVRLKPARAALRRSCFAQPHSRRAPWQPYRSRTTTKPDMHTHPPWAVPSMLGTSHAPTQSA
jgi:hypothetical protein